METPGKINIKEHKFYIAFFDDKNNYITAYGYDRQPAIMEMKMAIESILGDEDLRKRIPNLDEIIDFICFDVMTYEMFVDYIIDQEMKLEAKESKEKSQ